LGEEKLRRLGAGIYGDQDPTQHFFAEQPYEFLQQDGQFTMRIKLPFVSKEEVKLDRLADEMVIRIGGFKKHIPLPRHVATYKDVKGKMEGAHLNIMFGGKRDGKGKV